MADFSDFNRLAWYYQGLIVVGVAGGLLALVWWQVLTPLQAEVDTKQGQLDQLNQEYVLTARVKGMSEGRVIWRHAFRNVQVQLITIIGLTYASLLEGSVLTETVFSWPGIGQYITRSLFNADMNAVLGGTIVVGVCFVGINMFSDLLYKLVDPRAR